MRHVCTHHWRRTLEFTEVPAALFNTLFGIPTSKPDESAREPKRMVFAALVGVISYVYFFWSLPLQATAFMINLGSLVPELAVYFPYGIDDNARLFLEDFGSRLAVNVALLGLFAIPHSIFARPRVKHWFGAEEPTVYRALYCLKSSACLHLLIAYWQPVFETTLWSFSNPTIPLIGYGMGWFWLVTSTFAIDHFELFGVKQALGIDLYSMVGLQPGDGMVERLHYGLCRHPIMLGFFIMFVSVCIPTACTAQTEISAGANNDVEPSILLTSLHSIHSTSCEIPGGTRYGQRAW